MNPAPPLHRVPMEPSSETLAEPPAELVAAAGSRRLPAQRTLRLAALGILALAVVIAVATGARAQPTEAGHDAPGKRATPFLAEGFRLGVFTGGFDPNSAAQYEAWLGRPSDFNVTFLTDVAFTDYVKPDGSKVTDSLMHSGWLTGVWIGAKRPDRNMLFSVPLATKQDTSLANVADGKYDAPYTLVAQTIAKSYPKAIIRIGWEFNGDWYAWSAQGRAPDYIRAFRHIAQIFRTASPDFTIDWCPAQGFSGKMPADSAYPGDDVVDVIGMDVYNDYKWGNFKDDPVKRWEWMLNYDRGLAWQARFAAQHGKPMSIPEWGVNRDDPYFIEHMHDWILHHDYAYVAYWDSNSAFAGSLRNNQYPNAAETFRRLFDAPDSAL